MSHIPKKAHWPPFYIYLQTACIALATWYFTHTRYQDDAYISLVYARNLINGNGLVWNPGEVVEGYSNFLFLILTSALGALGMDMVLASTVLSFAGYVGLLWVLWRYTGQQFIEHFGSTSFAYAHQINRALCMALVGSSVIILAWCFGGLEPLFFAMLLTVPVCMVLQWLDKGVSYGRIWVIGTLFALAAMTRTEAVMIWGLSGLFLGCMWLFGRSGGKVDFFSLVFLGCSFLFLYLPYTAWRLDYFGELLPNTFYAKLYGMPDGLLYNQGLFYFLQFVIMPPMLLLFAIVLLYLTGRKQPLNAPIYYLALLVIMYCAYIIKSGGDHMYYFRFFVPVIPLLALLIYHLCSLTIPRDEKRFRDVCGALLILLVLQFGMVQTDEHGSAGAASGKAVAGYVNQHWPKGASIALNPVGALPYYAPDYHYVDMLGLVNKPIARRSFIDTDEKTISHVRQRGVGHQKGDGAYVLAQQPDYIIFGNAAWGTSKPVFLSDMELAAHPDFARQYERIEHYITPPVDMLPALQAMAEKKALSAANATDQPDTGPVLDDLNRLRFVYYRKITPSFE